MLGCVISGFESLCKLRREFVNYQYECQGTIFGGWKVDETGLGSFKW